MKTKTWIIVCLLIAYVIAYAVFYHKGREDAFNVYGPFLPRDHLVQMNDS